MSWLPAPASAAMHILGMDLAGIEHQLDRSLAMWSDSWPEANAQKFAHPNRDVLTVSAEGSPEAVEMFIAMMRPFVRVWD